MKGKEFWENYKVYIIIGGLLAFAGVGVWVYFSILNKGKKDGVSQVLAHAPDEPGDTPYSDDERRAAKILSDRLWSMTSSWFGFIWSDSTLFEDCVNASDRIMVLTYNEYKLDHTSHELVTDLIGLSEYFASYRAQRDILVSRLKRLLNL